MICTIRKTTAVIASVVAVFAALSGDVVAQMAIPGKFEVSPVGAATYTIPIQVPPGIAGIEPRLALNYNSRRGNGLVGMGWTLDGLSTITRCPRTTPQDGIKGAVRFDANDRFCLDGKRLMVVSGTYGDVNPSGAGPSYRTEIDSFAKVTAFGSAGSGPQYFVVKTRDGLTMEFGGSADSRVPVAGLATIRVWALNKVVDAMGNTQRILYGLPSIISTSTTEFNAYPQRIDYTSNSTTGLPAANSVEFGYMNRAATPTGGTSDVISGYQGGYPFKTSVRLASITTKTQGATVSTYTLDHNFAGGRMRLNSVSLCAPDGLCAPVTRFVVEGQSPAHSPSVLPVTQTESSVSGGKWLSLDVDGDGKADLVHLTEIAGVYRVWLSNGDGSFTIRETTATADTALSTGSWQVLDVDGDGRADLVHLTTTPGLVQVWRSNGDGTFAISPFSNSDKDTNLSNGSWLVIDVNGDGLADLVHLVASGAADITIWGGPEDMRIWTSNGDGTFAITQFSGGGGTVLTLSDSDGQLAKALFGSKWQVMDVDGDGLADLVQTYSDRSNYDVYLIVRKSNGNGTFGFTKTLLAGGMNSSDSSPIYTFIPLDVNQDGLVDLVFHLTIRVNVNGQLDWRSDKNKTITLLSRGNGTFDALTLPGTTDYPLLDGTWQVADTTGDGIPDLIHTPSNLSGGWYQVWRSNGNGTFAISIVGQTADTCSSACTNMREGDFLGVGAPGFVRIDGNAVKSAWFLSASPADLTTAVTNGLDGITSWDLKPLPAILGSSYVKDTPSDNNTWTIASAMPVVTSVRTNVAGWVDGNTLRHLDRVTEFSYGSARVERNGRGFVGFRWQQARDSVTGLTTRTIFRQDFPYTGLVESQGTGSGGSWSNLNLTSTSYGGLAATQETGTGDSYGCVLLVDAGCSIAAGKRYFVYPSQVETQSRDLDGTALPRTRVVNGSPDHYGNLQSTTTSILNADGSPTDYVKETTNTYYNNPTNWIIGRLVKSVVKATGPTVAAPVTPGSGGLPAAVPPQLPPQVTGAIMSILQLLLSDD